MVNIIINDYPCTYTTSFLTKDSWLRLGLLNLVEEYVHNKRLKANFVFFTAEYYYEVLERKDSFYDTVFILFIRDNPYSFLSELPAHRVSISVSLQKLIGLLDNIDTSRFILESQNPHFHLTEREATFIAFSTMEMLPAEISVKMELHIKTIYDLRLSVLKKFGCSTFNSFSVMIHNPFFKTWMASHYHNINKQSDQNCISHGKSREFAYLNEDSTRFFS
ncbi:hypothetical protein AB1E22_00350 [Buttiauxella gaviniae]|uniref:Uncharacterized protein n=1 Tax=Buttiauxella gaviniae TaxID=82990 RepID=A0ABV3NNT9_9ENTR